MSKKYELVADDFIIDRRGVKLFRIRALVTIGLTVAVGDLGGYIEVEKNLSQVFGDAWVFGDAEVSGDARVSGDAWVFGDAEVSGDARVSGNAEVFGNARVSGDAWVFGDAEVSGDARVSGNAWVFGNAEVFGNARVSGNAEVFGNARVSGDAEVSGNARVSGDARVFGNARVSPVCISGLTWYITIADDQMTIGCQSHPLAEWWAFDDTVIKRMDIHRALDFWKIHKPYLQAICKASNRPSGLEAE